MPYAVVSSENRIFTYKDETGPGELQAGFFVFGDKE